MKNYINKIEAAAANSLGFTVVLAAGVIIACSCIILACVFYPAVFIPLLCAFVFTRIAYAAKTGR